MVLSTGWYWMVLDVAGYWMVLDGTGLNITCQKKHYNSDCFAIQQEVHFVP